MRTVLLLLALFAGNACTDGEASRDRAVEPLRGIAGGDTTGFEIIHVPLGHPTAAALVLDVDGDGRSEALVGGGDHVTVLTGSVRGIEVVATIAAGEQPVDLAVGDLDGDGRTDVVIANHDADYVTLLEGGGDGFAEGRPVEVDVTPHPHAVVVADVDGDGRLELLVDDRDREALRVYRPDGGGGLEPVGRIAVGGDPYRGMVVADIDGDGNVDIVTPNPSVVSTRLGDGAGSFAPGPTLRPTGFRPFTVAVGDFDGDAVPDIGAGSGEGSGGAAIWLGDGEGGFEPAPGSPFVVGDGPTASAVADVDGDGLDDLLLTNWTADELAIVHGGSGGHRIQRIRLGGSPWGVGAGDLDGDGDADIVVCQGDGDGVWVLLRH